jgi:hypothetical protein
MNHVFEGEQLEDVRVLRMQRELAVGSLILSASISLAVLCANLGREPKAMSDTREDVAVHREIARHHKVLLKQNQELYVEVQTARNLLIRNSSGR